MNASANTLRSSNQKMFGVKTTYVIFGNLYSVSICAFQYNEICFGSYRMIDKNYTAKHREQENAIISGQQTIN